MSNENLNITTSITQTSVNVSPTITQTSLSLSPAIGSSLTTWGSITGVLSNQTDLYAVLQGKISLTDLSSTATGLTYDNTTGVFSLTSGYEIPLSTTLNTFITKDVDDLTYYTKTVDLPFVNNGLLTIQKNGTGIGSFGANQATNETINIAIPTKTSDLTNDNNFVSKDVDNLTNYMLTSNINTALDLKANQTDLTNEINDRQEADSDLQEEINTLTENVNTKVEKNNAITSGTHTKITYDSKGLVTSGTDLSASDIPNLLLSKITDVSASASELNILDGAIINTTELNYLDGTTSNVQTQINSKLNITDVINNVTTTTTNQALSANMGKELQDQITNLKQRGRYLSIWNSTTGLATTTPTVNPYTYKAGDYFIVGFVGETNYRPTGSTYDKDVPSTVVETETVIVNDTYYYDGTTWSLLHTSQPTVAFSTLAGSPYDNANLTSALNAKQNTLSAGTGISLSSNSVSINQVATEGYNISITGTLTTLNGVLSGFSSSDYATVPVQFNPSDDSWEIVYKFTTASTKPSRYRYILGSLQGSNSIVIGQYSTGVLTYWLSSQGGSNWDICSDQRGTIVLSDNTTYTVSVAYDGHSIYTMSISTNDGVSWDMDTSVTSSSDIYGGTIYLGSPYDRSNDTCWQGSIDLNNCRMKIGRQGEIWVGFSTTENIAKATENLYGLVKPDNSTITISNGVISASPAIDNSTITINTSDQIQAVNLVGLTSTITELNYTDGVTSNIQTQLNNKVGSTDYASSSNYGVVKVDNSSIYANNGVITANKATGNYSVTFVGNPATTTSALNVGANSTAHGWYATALGCDAVVGDKTNDVRVAGAIQLGRGTNQEAGTLYVGLSNNGTTWNNYKLLDSTGKIPNDRVTVVDDTSTTSTTLSWSASKLNTTIGDIETLLQALR